MYVNGDAPRFFLGFILQNLYVFNIHKVEISKTGVSIMRSKRTPDRVHVVKPPEQQNKKPASSNIESREIALMLAQISDKLKRSEAERYKLLTELRDYRETLTSLKEKADTSERAFRELESRFSIKGSDESVISDRQAKFEKTLKATEEKMVKAIAGQALIDKRLQDTEEKQMMIHQQIEKSMDDQKKIEHQIEMNVQDKSRLLRKMERLEEMMTDTQDTLRAKAMVLLTDKSASSKAQLHAPAWGNGSPQIEGSAFTNDTPMPWQKYINLQSIGIASMILAALLAGWAISQIQKTVPDEQFQSLEKVSVIDEMDDSQSGVSDVNIIEAQKTTERIMAEQAAVTTPIPDDVTQLSDDQLNAAFDADPDALAAQLNNIEPQALSQEQDQKTLEEAPLNVEIPLNQAEEKDQGEQSVFSNLDMTVTSPVKDFEDKAFQQDMDIANEIDEIIKSAPSLAQFPKDNNLPPQVKKIETAAFDGKAEAQHDMGAIYTAGPGDITQNFEKANFWFLQAAQKDVPNAIYNLGVLNHQGLGVEQDLNKALYWYREAAKLNHAEAQYNLGISHIEGIGTDYDPNLAAGFFERAANNGIIEAAYNLGLIYENGLLGSIKLEEALLWYNISAKQGNLEAQKAMEQIAKKLQIGTDDIDKFVERMQEINQSVKGKRAGPDMDKTAQNTLQSNKAVIAQIQEYLSLANKYDGPSDGINGTKTKAAIRSYQAENNMNVTGMPSKTLLNHMVSSTLANVQ